jgi:hypothetical protein
LDRAHKAPPRRIGPKSLQQGLGRRQPIPDEWRLGHELQRVPQRRLALRKPSVRC